MLLSLSDSLYMGGVFINLIISLVSHNTLDGLDKNIKYQMCVVDLELDAADVSGYWFIFYWR